MSKKTPKLKSRKEHDQIKRNNVSNKNNNVNNKNNNVNNKNNNVNNKSSNVNIKKSVIGKESVIEKFKKLIRRNNSES